MHSLSDPPPPPLSSDSPARKRGRCDSLQNTGPPEKFQAMSHCRLRDDSYYFDDGSCVLLVQDTLFNVHRSILSKDSSSFKSMFTLPQGDRITEGISDDNPITLHGDTVAEFRHFLWVLYALPPELAVVTSPSADLTQLMDIARISNKYAFKTLETWALDAIQEYVNQKPSPILSAMPPPSTYTFPFASLASSPSSYNPKVANTEQLTCLIRLAQMCNHERLLNTMVSLLRQLMTGSVQYAYLAMTLADELDLRALRGAAYLEVMQKAIIVNRPRVDIIQKPPSGQSTLTPDNSSNSTGSPAPTPPSNVEQPGVDDKKRISLTPQQQLRLLAGYYRLTDTWEELRKTPPHFDHAISCGATWHQHGCTQSWLEFWKEKTRSDTLLTFGLADVLGRLKQVQKDYDRWGSATYMHHDCRQAARRSIIELTKRVEDALPDYFSDADLSD